MSHRTTINVNISGSTFILSLLSPPGEFISDEILLFVQLCRNFNESTYLIARDHPRLQGKFSLNFLTIYKTQKISVINLISHFLMLVIVDTTFNLHRDYKSHTENSPREFCYSNGWSKYTYKNSNV